jgi:hypothetical protein
MLYRSRMNPALGRNFEAMDPLEWLARMSDTRAARLTSVLAMAYWRTSVPISQ